MQNLKFKISKKLWTVDCGLWTKSGFTLIEILVVLVILGFFVAMAAQVFIGQDDQRRFDETRIRMGEIREAILGREGAFALGQRQFAGYVVDMGELPDLVDEHGAVVPNGQPKGLWTRDLNSDGDTIDAVDIPDAVIWKYRTVSQTWMGWRGPYLETPPRGDNVLRDGWGNPFVFDDTTSPGDMTITSPGANGVINPADTGFNEDVALVIRRTEYMAPVAGQVGTGVTEVKIYFPMFDGVDTDGDGSDLIESSTISGLSTGGFFRFERDATGTGTSDGDIPGGLRSIQVTGGSGRLYIFTVEPTANWLGTLE